jgi:hypothetical protein
MRRILMCTLMLTACAATTGVQTQTALDNPVRVFVVPNPLPPCGLATAILHLEQSVNALIGFERQPNCPDNPNLFPDLSAQTLNDLSGRTVRQVLDHLIALDPAFQWRDVNGVAVVRPVMAWDDAANPLNVAAEPFTLVDGQLTDAVAAAVRRVKLQVAGAADDAATNRRFSVEFTGGSMLEALNTVIQAHGAAVWEIQPPAPQDSATQDTSADSIKPVDITVRTFDASGSSFATPVVQPPPPLPQVQKKRDR